MTGFSKINLQSYYLRIIFFVGVIGCTTCIHAQDAFFSTYDNKSLYYNPAHTAFDSETNKSLRLSFMYRDQWTNVSNIAFRSMLLEAEKTIYKSTIDSWNLGGYIFSDKSNDGLLSLNSANFSARYSRKFGITRTKYSEISLGSNIGYFQTSINDNDLWFGRQYDQSLLSINSNFSNGETTIKDGLSFFSVGVGATYNFRISKKKDLIFSASSSHVNQPSSGLTNGGKPLHMRNFFSIAYTFSTNKKLKHKTAGYIISQGPYWQILPQYMLTIMAPYDQEFSIETGATFRLVNVHSGVYSDACILHFGIQSKKWQVGVNYEINVSELSGLTNNQGGFQINAAYYIGEEI